MRIFQVLEFNQFNTGSVHQMFQAAAGLRARGHEVTVISRPDPILQQKCEEGRIAFEGLPLRNQFDVFSIRQLQRLVSGKRPDVIHVHKGVAHALALAATWRNRAGAFIVNRGVSFPLDVWNRTKFRTRHVDRVVTVCEQIRQVVIVSGKLPPEKVVVVYAGTDVDEFDPAKWDRLAFRREKNIGADHFLVGQVGVRDWKGWKELIDAAAMVKNIRVALIGCRDDAEAQHVKSYAEQRRVADRVDAIEYRTDMPNVLAACDLVVDASWAGTGITGTIREAMTMAKPVIATDCGGNAELVSSRDVGWLIPARDVTALANAINDVVGRPDRAAVVGTNARARVVRGFSKDLRISRLENLYATVLKGRSAARSMA